MSKIKFVSLMALFGGIISIGVFRFLAVVPPDQHSSLPTKLIVAKMKDGRWTATLPDGRTITRYEIIFEGNKFVGGRTCAIEWIVSQE